MFYESLFNPSIHRPVKACLTGAGEFGASFLSRRREAPARSPRRVHAYRAARGGRL